MVPVPPTIILYKKCSSFSVETVHDYCTETAVAKIRLQLSVLCSVEVSWRGVEHEGWELKQNGNRTETEAEAEGQGEAEAEAETKVDWREESDWRGHECIILRYISVEPKTNDDKTPLMDENYDEGTTGQIQDRRAMPSYERTILEEGKSSEQELELEVGLELLVRLVRLVRLLQLLRLPAMSRQSPTAAATAAAINRKYHHCMPTRDGGIDSWRCKWHPDHCNANGYISHSGIAEDCPAKTFDVLTSKNDRRTGSRRRSGYRNQFEPQQWFTTITSTTLLDNWCWNIALLLYVLRITVTSDWWPEPTLVLALTARLNCHQHFRCPSVGHRLQSRLQ